MYTVAVVDDDLRQCRILADMIADAPFSSFDILTFQSVPDLESFQAHHGPVDICLMDVRMDDDAGRFSDGIEAVSRLFPEGCGTQVICVTGYVEYATPVYETPHVYFLLKPVQAEQLYAALGKALERLASQTGAYLPVTCGGAVRRLPVGKIIYLESNRRKVIVHMVDDTVETYAKLSDFEDQLPPNFVRSHMSFLVNMNYLEWVDGKTATLSTGIQLPVSRQRSVATREAFHRHLRGFL